MLPWIRLITIKEYVPVLGTVIIVVVAVNSPTAMLPPNVGVIEATVPPIPEAPTLFQYE
jgi:hypothetical protein